MRYCFSRFAHQFTSGQVTCYLNSLRLRPVYLNAEVARPLDRLYQEGRHGFFEAADLLTHDRSYEEILSALEAEKIIAKSPAVDNVLHKARSSVPPPALSIMYLIVSEQCNLSCSYCFMNSSLKKAASSRRQRMSLETANQALSFFADVIGRQPDTFDDEKTIIIYGGEPFTNKECVLFLLQEAEGLKEAKRLPEKTNLVINSNGTLLDAELAQAVARYGASISLSIDGGRAEFNRERKFVDGRETFDAVIKAIELLRAHEVHFGLSITLTDVLLDRGDELLESIEELNIKNIGINPLIPSSGRPASERYGERIADFIIKAYKRLSPLGFSEDRIGRKILCFANATLYPWDCGAGGGRQIVVAPDGQVGICHGLIGNRTDFAAHVSDSHFDPATSDVFWKWREFSPIFYSECEGCPAMGICGGGCALRAYETTGKWNTLDKQFCHHARKTLDFLVWEYWKRLSQGEREREVASYETNHNSAAPL